MLKTSYNNCIMHEAVKKTLSQKIIKILGTLGLDVDLQQVLWEIPADKTMGHFTTTIALTQFSQLLAEEKERFNSPKFLADELVKQLEMVLKTDPITFTHNNESLPVLHTILAAGPGFINFTYSNEYLLAQLPNVVNFIEKGTIANGKTAIVEFSSPNIAKPFTVGHLRSTVIGASLANLLEKTGWQVLRDNHLGDWGTQFGKQIYALKHLGKGTLDANIRNIKASEQPVKELVKLYVEFHEKAEKKPEILDEARAWFKKLEDGDQEARLLWQQCVDWSWVEFTAIYKKLGIQSFYEKFDNGRGLGESFFEDKMGVVIDELRESGLLKEGDGGAQLVFFPEEKYPPAMILKKDGSTLYHTRDLATDKYRKEQYHPDLILNEVGAEQTLYFKQLFEIEQMLGWYTSGQRVHIGHGMIRFADTKMSTRKGNVVWLEDVLQKAVDEVKSLIGEKKLSNKTVSAIAYGALKWSDLKRSAHLDVVFDWSDVVSLSGNSGPYLQYTYVRCHSILTTYSQNSKNRSITDVFDTLINNKYHFNLSFSETENNLLVSIKEYFDAIEKSASEYAPHHLCNYLYALAQLYNSFYTQHKVLGDVADPDVQHFRIVLTQVVASILKDGLAILGIEVVEEM